MPRSTITNISPREHMLIIALRAIMAETMAYPPVRPRSSESYLPPELITQAQDALKFYGLDIDANPAMMASGVPA